MIPANLLIPVIGAAAAFGTAGAVLALMGLGAPFMLAALATSACAGLVLYAAMPKPTPPAEIPTTVQPTAPTSLEQLEAETAALRHDLRGALSPALMLSDRLVAHADPGVRRAGEAVVQSIERATALIAASRNRAKPPARPDP